MIVLLEVAGLWLLVSTLAAIAVGKFIKAGNPSGT